ncbi:hypothetical protein KY290_027574 [Solanum tuberosum]|uniref:Integrase core domain containing protein n=1 Tax=Solanum tuberosum TaxID=4113 RepID=A0ABQ7UH82_SOLTU|nr:hypothetical protein KY290_027574 [Solanum tuberosum]
MMTISYNTWGNPWTVSLVPLVRSITSNLSCEQRFSLGSIVLSTNRSNEPPFKLLGPKFDLLTYDPRSFDSVLSTNKSSTGEMSPKRAYTYKRKYKSKSDAPSARQLIDEDTESSGSKFDPGTTIDSPTTPRTMRQLARQLESEGEQSSSHDDAQSEEET